MQLHNYKRLLGRQRENLPSSSHTSLQLYCCITPYLLVCVTLPAKPPSLFLLTLEVTNKEEYVKSDKAKCVQSHLFEFKLADPVDAAADGTAGHTAHRPLSPAVRLTSCCKHTATSLLSGMTHSLTYLTKL
jgi:hypothetical protein